MKEQLLISLKKRKNNACGLLLMKCTLKIINLYKTIKQNYYQKLSVYKKYILKNPPSQETLRISLETVLLWKFVFHAKDYYCTRILRPRQLNQRCVCKCVKGATPIIALDWGGRRNRAFVTHVVEIWRGPLFALYGLRRFRQPFHFESVCSLQEGG